MENRGQSLYWNELTELRAAYEYAWLYRNHLAFIDTWISVARSVTGLAALGHGSPQNLLSNLKIVALSVKTGEGI